MLTYYDSSVIVEHAIRKKLDAERGVRTLDIKIKPLKDGIGVKVEALIDEHIRTESRFVLNAMFELRDVHNQIDQIAEGFKRARRNVLFHDAPAGLLGDADEIEALRGAWQTTG